MAGCEYNMIVGGDRGDRAVPSLDASKAADAEHGRAHEVLDVHEVGASGLAAGTPPL
jgi:hypothetical protein